jgi:uncharacterized protein YfcZ (UPF0381/DUF406 family)
LVETDAGASGTSLSCQILKAMKFIDPPSADEDCMLALLGVLERAGNCLGRKVILVVEAFTRASDVSEIAAPLRKITYDHPLACTALILSDALAAFSLKPGDRWELFFIDEFTDAEANKYLDKRNCLVDNAAARATLLNATTCGMDLHAFFQSKQSVEQFTRELIQAARGSISDLINVKNPAVELSGEAFEKLVCMLLKDEYNDGVSKKIANKFDHIFCFFLYSHCNRFLAAPADAATVLKKFHALLYHMPTQTYRLHSRTVRQAALEMFAEKKICRLFCDDFTFFFFKLGYRAQISRRLITSTII